MDQAMLQRHLTQAERHVVEGEGHLARQRELIRKLERDGHGSRAARKFLKSLEEAQALHVADRDRVRTELRSNASSRARQPSGYAAQRHL